MVSKVPGVRASERGKYQMRFTQGLGAPGGESLSPSLRPPRWVGNGGPSLVWEPRGGSSPHYWPPTQVGRQWWAIPGLSYTAGTSIPEVTWAPATLLLNQLRL